MNCVVVGFIWSAILLSMINFIKIKSDPHKSMMERQMYKIIWEATRKVGAPAQVRSVGGESLSKRVLFVL